MHFLDTKLCARRYQNRAKDAITGSASRAGGILTAVFAHSVNLKGVARCLVLIFTANFMFEVTHFWRKELNRTTATRAHHVMVAAAVVLVFVSGDSIMEGHFTRQTAFRQQLQRAVHSGEADMRVFLLYEAVQLTDGKMFPRLQECLQNRVPLGGLLKSNAFEVAM